MEQREEGLNVWQNPLIPLRFPKLFDLRADPFEKAQTDAGEMPSGASSVPFCSSLPKPTWRST